MAIILVTNAYCPKKISQKYPNARWAYFGNNYFIYKRWFSILNSKNEIDYKNILKKISYKNRDKYVSYIQDISEHLWDKLEWWMTRLASRDFPANDFYINFCYLKTLQEIIKSHPKDSNLLLIVDDFALIESIKINFSSITTLNIPTPTYFLLSKYLHLIGYELHLIKLWTLFFSFHIFDWMMCKLSKLFIRDKPPSTSSDHIIIHTCIDHQCLKPNGLFNDRYYPQLYKYLKKKGKSVSTFVWLYNVSKLKRFQIYRWFRKNKDSFLLPLDFCTPIDSIKSYFFLKKSSRLPIKLDKKLDSLNCSHLLKSEQQKQRSMIGFIGFINHLKIVENWHKKNIRISSFVDTWEKRFCETPLLSALEKYYPNCTKIAYQHGALIPKLLLSNYKTTPKEFSASPNADILVANGKLTYDFLINEGFPKSKVTIGPALRYLYLKNSKTQSKSPSANTILVTLPIDIKTACYIIDICWNTLKKLPSKCHFSFKLHPMIPLKKLQKHFNFNLASSLIWNNSSIEQAMQNTSILVCAEGSTVVESVYQKKNTILIEKPFSIELSPLDILNTPSNIHTVRSSHDLINTINSLQNMSEKPINTKDFFEFDITKLDDIFNL